MTERKKINQTEKTFVVVFIVGTGIFFYYFFIVPPTPIYWDGSPTTIVPRDAIYLPDGRIIIGYERSAVLYVAPVAITFYFFMIILTDGGRYRLREIINFRDGFAELKKNAKKRIREEKQEYKKWKNK